MGGKLSGKAVSISNTLCPQTNGFVDRTPAKDMVFSGHFFGTLLKYIYRHDLSKFSCVDHPVP